MTRTPSRWRAGGSPPSKILIACGGWPALPNIPGIEHAITSNEALDLPELPARMAIVGGGYIAVEFCGIFRAAGVEVTQIIRAAEVLRGFDEEVRAFLSAQMEKQGVRMLRETVVRAIEKNNAGLVLSFADGDALETDVGHLRDRAGAEHARPRAGRGRRRARATTAPSSSTPGIAARSRTSTRWATVPTVST